MSSESVGFVINYYSRPSFSPSHRTMTKLCIQYLKSNRGVGQIILVDGSQHVDSVMRDICDEEDIDYVHLSKELTFAEGWNAGWKLLRESYVGFIANDIFVPPNTIETLFEYLCLPDVGCVFPYLSYSDYPGQCYSYVRNPITCEPTAMTLNLNLIRRDVLEEIQGVDEDFLGCYNDIDLLIKIRTLGYRAVLVGNTRVFHFGKMTLLQGSTYQQQKDIERFKSVLSLYSAKHGILGIAHWKWPLATTHLVAFLWWVSQKSSSTSFRNFFQRIVIRHEPELTKYPAKFGNSRLRMFTKKD